MKKFSKILSVALLVALVLSLGVASAFAEETTPGTPSITIKPNDTTSAANGDITITYTYYKILSADIDTDPEVALNGSTTENGVVAYYVENANQAAAIAGLKTSNNKTIFNVTQVGTTNKWYVELNEETNASAEEIVTAFNNTTFLSNFTAQTFENSEGGDAVLPNITAGYYFIQSSLGSKIALQTLSPVTINEKNTYTTDNKTIPEVDEHSQIGQEIVYTLTVNVPVTANKEIVLTDTMSKGLTFVGVVDQDPIEGTISDVSNAEQGATKFTITYTEQQIKDLVAGKDAAQTITVHVKVKVNNEAKIDTGIPNTLDLKYGNVYDAQPKTVYTETTKFDFDKVDGTDKVTKLTGAEFKFTKNSANTKDSTNGWISLVEIEAGKTYRIATEDDTTTTDTIVTNGNTVTINGLDLDETYYLVETKAPTGYNILAEHVVVETATTAATTDADGNPVPAETKFVHKDIENNKGTQLPSTGGIGTTIFYVVGGVLVLAAIILLVTKKRMSE